MSKKQKAPERPLTERIAKARREQRTQQALELARQLVKQEPTAAHGELLRQTTLERGQELQARGMTSDAATVYANALALGGTTAFLADVAQRLAACGAMSQALAALANLPDPSIKQKVLQGVADGAVAKGPTAKAALPAEMHGPFDLILQAFAHYEAGRDEEARASLRSLGLQSPFLEWKLFLRGMLAFQASDDARALENWQRLDPHRLPYRLCATLRAAIDPAFLAAQPPAVQQALKAKLMQQQGVSIAPVLRDLREILQGDNLAPAFRKAEQVVAVLRREHPDLASRLGQCFYWAIVENGQPEDIDRYARVFGYPADDRDLHRLQAIALEARGLWPEAHESWKYFIEDVANAKGVWPGDSARHVQALIWARMADNANPRRQRRSRSGDPLLDLFASHGPPLKPGAEECYEKSIALVSDRLETYRALFEIYRQENKAGKAKKIGQELLKRFPDHFETLEALGDLSMDAKDFNKAQEYFEKSIQANPLERSLRVKLARACQIAGLNLTIQKKYDKAREQYEKAVKLWDGSKTPLLCQWAVAEMKAGNPVRAAELIAQAQADPDQRLACRYALVGESVRAKLDPKTKKQIANDLKTALAEKPTPAEILVLLESAAHQRVTHEHTFHGQKSQEKTFLKFLDGIKFDAFNEAQLQRLCTGLQTLEARKPWLKCLTFARRHHLKNPFFRLSYVDYYLTENTRDPKTHLAREHLEGARRLIEEMPRGELQQQMLEQLKDKEKIIAEINKRHPSFMDVMSDLFDRRGPVDPFDDEVDDDDDDEGDFW